jgi:hypothetical protein
MSYFLWRFTERRFPALLYDVCRVRITQVGAYTQIRTRRRVFRLRIIMCLYAAVGAYTCTRVGAYTQVGAYTLYAVQADVRCVYTVGAYNKAYDWCV